MKSKPPSLLFTCEHGGNKIPPRYRQVFRTARAVLDSHRGHDPGALELARQLAKACHAPMEFETTSRLLIELNRTLGHPRIFSEFSRQLPEEVRQKLTQEIYLPYRNRVTERIETLVRQGPVVHLSIHSFTPVLNEKTRRTDIGLLFDPAREFESQFANAWRRSLRKEFPDLAIHFNLPYRGTSDGFTTLLRTQFPDRKYAGIEVEVNQKLPLGELAIWKRVRLGIIDSLNVVQRELECLP